MSTGIPDVPPEVLDRLAGCRLRKGECILRGSSVDEITGFERKFNVALPAEYRTWLMHCDYLAFLNVELYGVRGRRAPGLAAHWQHFMEALALGWMPIGSNLVGGSYAIATVKAEPLRPGCVGELDMDFPVRPYEVVASSLWPFLSFIIDQHDGDERWPWDAEYVLEQDPGLRDWQAPPPLPWEAEAYWAVHLDQAEVDAYWAERVRQFQWCDRPER